MSKIFISYRRDDSDAASRRIYDQLAAHFGAINVFKDVDTIPAGTDFVTHLRNAMQQCSAAIIVIGPRWLSLLQQRQVGPGTDYVRLEIEAALTRNIITIPVLLDGAAMPAPQQLPASIAPLVTRQAAQVRSGATFQSDVGNLITYLSPFIQPASGITTIEPLTPRTLKDGATFLLGHQLSGHKYRTQQVQLPRPREGHASSQITCQACGKVVSIEMSSMREVGTKYIQQYVRVYAMLIPLGAVLALAGYAAIASGGANVSIVAVGIAAIGTGAAIGSLVGLIIMSFAAPFYRVGKGLERSKTARLALLPRISAEYSRQGGYALGAHRLIAPDKREFLATERKRGLRDLRIPLEDRL